MARHLLLLTVLVIVLSAAVPAMAEHHDFFAGEYVVEGWDPGNEPVGTPDYVGRATVSHWGESWRYRSFMDNQTYAGAGIYDEETGVMSFSFANGDGAERGVTVLHNEDGTLKGRWVMDTGGTGDVGHEIWTKVE